MFLFPILLLVASTIVVSHAKQEFAEIKAIYRQSMVAGWDQCIAESNVDPELVNRLLDFGEFPDGIDALKCYLKCYLTNLTVIHPDGHIEAEYIRTHSGISDPVLAAEVFNKCKTVINEDDLCGTAYEICKCVYKGAEAALQDA